jgi:AraC-like DNA-binding protein/quercetin dioxygenase-like cupin family protein
MDRVPLSPARSFGRVLRGHHWDGLSVEEVLMPPGLVLREHRHEGAQLYFVLEGSYLEASGDHEQVLGGGATWFRDAGVAHRNAVVGRDPALTMIVTANPSRLRYLAGRQRRGPIRSLLVDDVRSEILDEIGRGDEAAGAALEGWALLLLSRVERALAGRAPGDRLRDAVDYIERSYAEPISLLDVAAAVGMQPATLAAAFRRGFRTSVGERIRQVRLREAKNALLSGRAPIKQIAVECGFFDQAHLTRWCKRAFGLSPGELRRSIGVAAADEPHRDA